MRSGHAVTRHSVSFYAPDSEQAGLLARAQEIENLERELRAQALITDESRAALVRAEAAYADASQRLVSARRESSEARSRAHELQVETLRLSQLAEQTRARGEQIAADLAEVEAQLEALQERRVTAEARFEELDMALADTQERHAQLDERVMLQERKLSECREQQRSLERQAQEAAFSLRSLDARKAELSRAIETAAQQMDAIKSESERAQVELTRLTDAAAQAGLQSALALKLDDSSADSLTVVRWVLLSSSHCFLARSSSSSSWRSLSRSLAASSSRFTPDTAAAVAGAANGTGACEPGRCASYSKVKCLRRCTAS